MWQMAATLFPAVHASRENTLWKNSKTPSGLQRRFVDGRTDVISTTFSSTAGRLQAEQAVK